MSNGNRTRPSGWQSHAKRQRQMNLFDDTLGFLQKSGEALMVSHRQINETLDSLMLQFSPNPGGETTPDPAEIRLDDPFILSESTGETLDETLADTLEDTWAERQNREFARADRAERYVPPQSDALVISQFYLDQARRALCEAFIEPEGVPDVVVWRAAPPRAPDGSH